MRNTNGCRSLLLALCVTPAVGFMLPTPTTPTSLYYSTTATASQSLFPIQTTTTPQPRICLDATKLQAAAAAASSLPDEHNHSNNHKGNTLLWRSVVFKWLAVRVSAVWNAVRLKLRRWVPVVALAAALYFRAVPLAHAAAPDTATSLRPGMTRTQAELVEQGTITRDQVTTELTTSSGNNNNPLANPEYTPAKAVQQAASASADYDEDDEDYEDYTESSINKKEKDGMFSSNTPLGKKSSSSKSSAPVAGITTRSKFATMQRHSEHNEQVTKLKVSLCVFVPTFGGTIIREYLRRRRENLYVKKGLEIQKAQYAEYFNITETTENSDIQDALKKEVFNKTKTEDDDDDDEDDDDDDDDEDDKPEPPKSSRKRPAPKKPRGPEGGGGGGKDGSGDGGAGGGPSEEDLDRLNQMFKKS